MAAPGLSAGNEPAPNGPAGPESGGSIYVGGVSYQFDCPIAPDPGSPDWIADATDWVDGNGDGDTSDPGEQSVPIAYVRNERMTVSAAFKVTDPNLMWYGPAFVRGTGPDGIAVPVTEARQYGSIIALSATEVTTAFGNAVNYYPSFTIAWQVSLDGGETWYQAGSSHTQLYVTLATPAVDVVYHTYIHLSVAYSIGATTEAELIAGT